jgi:hypothetical protein
MIRRDYILQMIEEFFQFLSRLNSLKTSHQWQEASAVAGDQFQKLLGVDAEHAVALTETELLAKIIAGEPTQTVRDKVLMLVALFKEQGDIAFGQVRPEESRAAYLKGLHLLLHVMATDPDLERPEFVPKVEEFLSALHDKALPLSTEAMLMRFYEQTGQFARAEDSLFAMLELEPANPSLLDFGLSFYQRLESRSDSVLAEGDLPRAELDAGAEELRQRKAALVVPAGPGLP